MSKKIKIVFSLFVICLAVFFMNNTTEPSKRTSDSYEIKAVKIPNNLNFAGEKIPLFKQDIRERVDREFLVNTYWQSNALLLIKRTNKYFPIIEPILERNGIPNDFKYLAVIESGLQNVTSPAGARGVWQLMKETAKEYGLEVNSNVDERYHLEKATQTACDYLMHSKELLGSWTLAAAAYNAGNTGVLKQLKRQNAKDYYDLLLSEETQRYLPRIVAIKEILSQPENYGFIFEKEDLYNMQKYNTVTVDTAITNIATFANSFGTNYKELKILNPWLRENKLNNKTRVPYEIKIPK